MREALTDQAMTASVQILWREVGLGFRGDFQCFFERPARCAMSHRLSEQEGGQGPTRLVDGIGRARSCQGHVAKGLLVDRRMGNSPLVQMNVGVH